jgi:hypothetical protein
MHNPWDGNGSDCGITVLRGEEHCIISMNVSAPVSGSDDPRFAIEFTTNGGRTLRVRLPADQLGELANALLELANGSG